MLKISSAVAKYYWLSFLTFAVPAFSLVATADNYSLAAFFLLLSSIYLLFRHSNDIKFDQITVLCGIMFLAYPIYVFLYMLVDDIPLREFDKPLRFICAYVIFLMLRITKVSIKAFFLGAVVSGALVGYFALSDLFFIDNIYEYRFTVNIFVIAFSDIAVVVSFLILIACWFFTAKKLKLMTIISFLGCMLAVVLANTRGSWLAIPLAIFILTYLNIKISNIKRIGVVMFGVCILVIIYFSHSVINLRVNNLFYGLQSYSEYLQQEPSINKNNEYQYLPYALLGGASTIARLDMWTVSLVNIKEKALFGWGFGQSKEVLKASKGKVRSMSDFPFVRATHTHNNYLEILLEGGVVGLIAFMLFFSIGIYMFIKMIISHIRRKGQFEHFKAMHALAISGLLLLSSYLVFMVSEVLTHHEASTSFLVFMTAIILGLYHNTLEGKNG